MIDFQSQTPLYEQLKIQIIKGIATGRLKAGERLPSVRQLAVDLGINLHTVNKAYSQLKQDGFITIHRQKGVEVNPHSIPGATETFRKSLQQALNPLIIEAYCRGMDETKFCHVCQELFQNIMKDALEK